MRPPDPVGGAAGGGEVGLKVDLEVEDMNALGLRIQGSTTRLLMIAVVALIGLAFAGPALAQYGYGYNPYGGGYSSYGGYSPGYGYSANSAYGSWYGSQQSPGILSSVKNWFSNT